jgi:hypothetical protein
MRHAASLHSGALKLGTAGGDGCIARECTGARRGGLCNKAAAARGSMTYILGRRYIA